jgi:hypothetical protein
MEKLEFGKEKKNKKDFEESTRTKFLVLTW